ncbi:MAG: hypothetical protein A2987_07285 [Omnitrophica bacterium RIFCSPLOWO2_01_FULL_45_10]|nr:MAG: hypothetical protein A2987_07285 [Omnitrophica bacterium RIFCSPLOWO2_01_FULL_45_10]
MENPTHAYELLGTYTVSLTVTGPQGSKTKTRTDYIKVVIPLVFGTIYQEGNIPLEEAKVSILNLSKTQVLAESTTDSQGKFYLSSNNIPDGTYYIKVSKDGYKSYLGAATLRNNQVLPFSVTLQKIPSCAVSGTVYVANGSIDTIRIELIQQGGTLFDTRYVPANGRYYFSQNISVGTYKLRATAPWNEVQEKTVSFTTQGEAKTVDFNLTMPLPVAE